jgi:hypothetical protein
MIPQPGVDQPSSQPMTVDEGEVLRRNARAAVGPPSWIRSISEEERRHVDMKRITCLCVAVYLNVDRVMKEREPDMLLMNTRAFIEKRLKPLGILQFDGKVRGTQV